MIKTAIRLQPCQTQARAKADIGLVVLQNDSVSGPTLQRLFGPMASVQVARLQLPANPLNTALLEKRLRTASASILPCSAPAVIGLACTTAAMRLGHKRLQAAMERPGARVVAVDPLDAGFKALRHLGLRRIAILSPYARDISGQIARSFERNGFSVNALGLFGAKDAEITSIADRSIVAAAEQLAKANIDGLFLSCTGIRAIPLIGAIERRTGIPVLTSLSVMAWEFGNGLGVSLAGPGRLLAGGAGMRAGADRKALARHL